MDGNTDRSFFNGSVTHTSTDANAWWRVDLGASAAVSSIVVWNRTDCCVSHLSDDWVFVSDTPFLATDTPATAQGRYVRVHLSGTNNLNLAEVQVFGIGGAPAPTNLALGKSANQCRTLPDYPTDGASAAVNRGTDGIFFNSPQGRYVQLSGPNYR